MSSTVKARMRTPWRAAPGVRPQGECRVERAGQLRQRQDRDVQFLRQRLEAGGDLGHLLHTSLGGALARSRQELDVVDDQEVEALLPLEPARARRELGDRQAAGLVDIER